LKAAQHGRTFEQFVTDAVHEKLSSGAREVGPSAWMKHFGAAKGKEESIREIDAAIEEEFEKIGP
jgi:hypothetical protein